jgi:hypothetical protein
MKGDPDDVFMDWDDGCSSTAQLLESPTLPLAELIPRFTN